MLYTRPCVIDAIGFPNHTPWTQGIPDVITNEMRVPDIAVVSSICYTCAGNVIQCSRDQRLVWDRHMLLSSVILCKVMFLQAAGIRQTFLKCRVIDTCLKHRCIRLDAQYRPLCYLLLRTRYR